MQTESLTTSHLQCTMVQPVSENSCFGRKAIYALLYFTLFLLLSMTSYDVACPLAGLGQLCPLTSCPCLCCSLEVQSWWETKALMLWKQRRQYSEYCYVISAVLAITPKHQSTMWAVMKEVNDIQSSVSTNSKIYFQ